MDRPTTPEESPPVPDSGTSTPTSPTTAPFRIASLDQFRGYTVAGMFLVNFLGGYVAGTLPLVIAGYEIGLHPILDHHNTYCSYADTIMPQFMFAVGFAFRLTFGSRVRRDGPRAAYGKAIRRVLGLILIGLVVYGLDGSAGRDWNTFIKQIQENSIFQTLEQMFGGTPFQTLVHIGVTSLWILPVLNRGTWVRLAYLVFSIVLHAFLSYAFYFDWVMTHTGIDGGPLGFLTWSVPMLVGTFACDAYKRSHEKGKTPPIFTFLFWGALLMGLGWGISNVSVLYTTLEPAPTDTSDPRFVEIPTLVRTKMVDGKEVERSYPNLAASPVIPPQRSIDWANDWQDWVMEPPFVAPPPPTAPKGTTEPMVVRKWNYWMMSQRAGTPSYLIFGAGFSLVVLAIFIVFSDILPGRIGLFRTFGTNALAAYILHELVANMVRPWVPRENTPLPYVLLGFALFFSITYMFIRHLEKERIFIRL